MEGWAEIRAGARQPPGASQPGGASGRAVGAGAGGDAAAAAGAAAGGWQAWVRLPRDHYVRVDANDSSVDPSVIGRRVQVHADLEQVRVRCGGRLVAEHVRCWARGQSITAPEHARAARQLRAARRLAVVRLVETEVQRRDLGDYDRYAQVELAAGRPLCGIA